MSSDTKEIEDQYDLFDEEEDFLSGLDEPPRAWRRRRRGSGAGGLGAGLIILSPSTLTTTDATPVGTVIGTATIINGVGSYTFSLVDPTGRFTITPAGQIKVASPLAAGFFPVTINATNGIGDNPTLATTIFVSHVGVYVPTYHIYGF